MSKARRRFHSAVTVALLVGCMIAAFPGVANALSTPEAFGFRTYRKGVPVTWSKVPGATSYQVKVRSSIQSSAAGYVFTLPASCTQFRLTKKNFPARNRVGGYIFTLCTANSRTRKCVSIGARPATQGGKVSTNNRVAAARKANLCLDDATDAFAVTASVGLASMIIPGAGELTAGIMAALAVVAGGSTYVVCAARAPHGSFEHDDFSCMSSSAGGFQGGGGGGGGGGGSWRFQWLSRIRDQDGTDGGHQRQRGNGS
jgi:hypothetical protein